MIQVFDTFDTLPPAFWVAIFCGIALTAGWLWFGGRVVLTAAAIIAGALLGGFVIGSAAVWVAGFAAAHTSLVLGFVLGFGLGGAVGLLAWVLWGVAAVGGGSDRE